MVPTLDADVALIHIAGGEARLTSPPGTLAQTPPRRAARGRADDLLFVSLGLHSTRTVSPALLDQLAQLAAEAYFGTPGSITAALRQAADEVNDRLLDAVEKAPEPLHLQGRLVAAVLRGQDLFLAQSGMGQAVLVRPGQVTRLASEEAANRPLGLTPSPYIRYQHIEVHPGDLLVLTTAPPPGWSDTTLSGLAGLDPAQAVDRLVAASANDLTGVLIRLAQPGEAVSMLPQARAAGRPSRPAATPGHGSARPSRPEATEALPQSGRPSLAGRRRRAAPRVPRSAPPAWVRPLRAISDRFSQGLAWLGTQATRLITRLAPGLAEPSPAGAYPRGLLIATAVAVPLIVVTIASVVYFRRGRAEQFQEYLSLAQNAVVSAQMKPGPQDAWPEWQAALNWLDLAEQYRQTSESRTLRQQVQTALDTLNQILRLDFRPAVSGGFGSGSRITALAATSTDLYVFDEAGPAVWRAWATGRGYEIDRDFQCLDGPGSVAGMGTPIDLIALDEPGALLTSGIATIDSDGTLLYCAPDTPPASSQLTPPDTGWGRIQAVDLFGGKLYVLDPVANAVWIYDAGGGLFSDNPILYFAEQVPNLSAAVDVAMAQDQLLILFADGHVESCQRVVEDDPAGGTRIRVTCEADLQFQDDRPGQQPSDHIPGAIPVEMVYSPPPEPSLYFLDSLSDSIYLYSMRLAYQGQIKPVEAFESIPTALTLGPPNDLFVAVGDQVYYAQP